MRRSALGVAVLTLIATPPAALAAAWTVRVEPLSGRIAPLRFVVHDQRGRVEVARTATATLFTMPGEVLFAYDSARITVDGAAILRQVAGRVGAGTAEVVGHTDARGSDAYNARLSRRRARAAARVLQAAGLQTAARGAGEAEPVASNRRASGRRRNRRVEVVVPRR